MVKIKTFKQYIMEDIDRSEAMSIYNDFKAKMESKYKQLHPNSNFKVVDKIHIIDQIVNRSLSPEKSGERGNIPIETSELKHIFNVVIDRFFRSKENEGISTQTSPNGIFRTNNKGDWEFQHKVFFDNKNHYRCIVYSVKIVTERAVNVKGKEYMKVNGISEFRLITINPSDRSGSDDYPSTNKIIESIESVNIIED